jgi:hypothetical protein
LGGKIFKSQTKHIEDTFIFFSNQLKRKRKTRDKREILIEGRGRDLKARQGTGLDI